MAKELVKIQPIAGVEFEAKIEDGKIVGQFTADLSALIDDAAKAIPGDSSFETLAVMLLKQAVKSV